jgi:type I restriction enzyme, S subunit
MPAGGPVFAYSPQICYFRPVVDGPLDSRFLYYWFTSAEFLRQTDALKAQTDMADFLSLQDIHSLTMQMPPVDEQRASAEVLGALDDKIAANQRAIQLADELIRVQYRALSGDPVLLGSIATNVRDQVDPKAVVFETPYVGLEHVPRRSIWLSDFDFATKVTSAKAAFLAGDVLFGKLRPYFHKVVSAPFDGIASTDILVLRAKRPELSGLVLAAASSDGAIAATTASSGGTRMPRTCWADLAAVEIPMPGDDEVLRFSGEVSKLADWAGAVVKESRELAATRDELLPLLMSGTVRVKDAEKSVEGVL